jgi:Zn-dependent protease with chaperone function
MLFGKPAMQLKRLNNLAIFATAVVIAFYVWNSNNYGGWTSGPRWFFWLTPLFLLAMLPVADWLARCRAGRGLAYLFLAVSVFSAAYPVWNPWRHPWIYQLCEYMNWVSY